VLMCSDSYADDISLSLPKRQLPPIPLPASKQSKATPRAASTWAIAIPDEPAQMMHTCAGPWADRFWVMGSDAMPAGSRAGRGPQVDLRG
jgi:hypothetical protein